MKIILDEKIVNIKIPSQVPKLKASILSDLFEKYDDDQIFEQMKKYTKNDYYLKDVDTIGIWMSGGADSSLLAYLLAKKIKDEKLNVNIQPLSVRRGRPWNPLYAANVIDFIVDDLKFEKMNRHIIYYPDINDEYYREISVFWEKDNENFRNDLFQILYSGITCNPPKSENISQNKERSRDESSKRPITTHNGLRYYINPFFDINKKHLYEIYKQYNLLESLFPITRSCEGSEEDSGNYTYHCGKCWWCEERFWAFGKYQ